MWLSLAACSAPDPAAAPAATAPTAAGPAAAASSATAPAPDAAAADCSRAGPLACAIAPIANVDSGSCAALTRCLAGRDTGEFGPGRIEAAVACEAPVFAPSPDPESDAGAVGGLRAAAVAAPLEVDGPPAHGAWLFVTANGGWCPADELAAPTWNHGGYCEMRFDMSWQTADGDGGPLLVTSAERTCHIALDQQELAAGESDVALVECRRTTHRFDNGALVRVSQIDSDGSCEMR